MTEIWKPMPQFEECYKISNFGNVQSLDRVHIQKARGNGYRSHLHKGQFIKLYKSPLGYLLFNAQDRDRSKSYRVHRAVALAFIDNPRNCPMVNHIDGNKLNNHYTNLEWCTRQENMDHAVKTGLIISRSGLNNPNTTTKVQIFKDNVLVKECFGTKELCEMGFAPTTVNRCIKGKKESYLGYTFKRIKIR